MYPWDQADPYMTEEPTPGKVLKKSVKKSAGDALTDTAQPKALPNAIEALRSKAANAYEQGLNLFNAEPEMRDLQSFAQQRTQQGESSMLNALAAQYAGENFQPVQAQFLKKAAAAQDPLKAGSGFITPDGKYIKDPTASQDKKAEFLLQQAKAYEQMATNAETAQERAEATRAQKEIENQLRMMGLNIQQQGLAIRAANAGKGDDSKIWRGEDSLRKDFDTITKDLREQMEQTSRITDIVKATPPGQKPDAITQQSLVILLNKFLDPGSVVREGEFDRVVKAQGLEGQARNLADRILKGQPLDANTIGQINGLAQLYYKASEDKMRKHASNYSEISKRRGYNPENVISDPRLRSGGKVVEVDF